MRLDAERSLIKSAVSDLFVTLSIRARREVRLFLTAGVTIHGT